MKGNNFIFNSVQLLYYKCHKVNFKRGGTYIEPPDRIKNKKVKRNPKSDDDKCFHYTATAIFWFMKKSKETLKEYQNLSLLLGLNKIPIKNRWLERVWKK